MATTTVFFFSCSSSPPPSSSSPLSVAPNCTQLLPTQRPTTPAVQRLVRTRSRNSMKAMATGADLGARDPFPAEIESNFADKVLGNVDTEHKILIPNAPVLSLAQQDCCPIDPTQPPLSLDEAKTLRMKVLGWRLLEEEEEEGLKLQCVWKLRDIKCAEELVHRITKVAEYVGHPANLHLEEPNQVRAELWTPSIGGLSTNDFILAAKIDQIKISDLIPRRRVWA